MNSTDLVCAASAATSARRGSSASIVARSASGCCPISRRISEEPASFPPKSAPSPSALSIELIL
jgi:hypothetical protein